MKSTFLPGSRLQVFLHIMAWSIFIIIPIFLIYTYGNGKPSSLWHFYTNGMVYGIIFYANYLILIPKLYFKHKIATYLVSLILLIIAMYFILNLVDSYAFNQISKQPEVADVLKKISDAKPSSRLPFKHFRMINFLFTSILIMGFSFGLGVLDKLTQNEKKRKELEKEKLNSELAFLKNQVSPHFFFNTLNNIYALIGIDAAMAQDSVLKLSKLMRYLLYESENGTTLISHEIDFMKNYIDLMKLRINPRIALNISFPENYTDYEISPLLFIPFIENAFKHGNGSAENAFIQVEMQIVDNRIGFITANSMEHGSFAGNRQHSGIGMENVIKRLNLLYPGKHLLTIDNNGTEFRVELEIET